MAPPRTQVGRAALGGRSTTRRPVEYETGLDACGSGGTNKSLGDDPSGAILRASDEAERLVNRVESIRVDVCGTCDRLLGHEPEREVRPGDDPSVASGIGQVGTLGTLLQRLVEEVDELSGQVARLHAL